MLSAHFNWSTQEAKLGLCNLSLPLSELSRPHPPVFLFQSGRIAFAKETPHARGASCVTALPGSPSAARLVTGGLHHEVFSWVVEERGIGPAFKVRGHIVSLDSFGCHIKVFGNIGPLLE